MKYSLCYSILQFHDCYCTVSLSVTANRPDGTEPNHNSPVMHSFVSAAASLLATRNCCIWRSATRHGDKTCKFVFYCCMLHSDGSELHIIILLHFITLSQLITLYCSVSKTSFLSSGSTSESQYQATSVSSSFGGKRCCWLSTSNGRHNTGWSLNEGAKRANDWVGEWTHESMTAWEICLSCTEFQKSTFFCCWL